MLKYPKFRFRTFLTRLIASLLTPLTAPLPVKGALKKNLNLSVLGSACLEVTQRALEGCCREKLIVELRGDMPAK